jgi:DNA-binding NarL/FixJ family response regulator
MRIVICDDAPLARSILSRLLQSLGHEVVAEAGEPGALIRGCVDQKPDLAILDGRLPSEGGIAAIERLRRAEPDLPIVVIASLDEVGLLRSALAAGASGGLVRPFLRSQVEATLQRFARTE